MCDLSLFARCISSGWAAAGSLCSRLLPTCGIRRRNQLSIPAPAPAASAADAPDSRLGGLLAAATYRGGKAHNEDSYFCEDFGACRVLAVADGVSSSDFAAVASRQLTQTLYRALATASSPVVADERFVAGVCRIAAQQIAQQLPPQSCAESTLIVLFEFANRYVLLYLGDGGAVRLRGNLRDGTSLLLSHHDEHGRLSGFVGGADPAAPTLSVVEFSKSPLEDGDILLIGTDGALPQHKETVHAAELVSRLFDRSQAAARVASPAEITRAIAEYLADSNPDDNATLGLLFSEQALAYWRRRCEPPPGYQEDISHECSACAFPA